MTRIKKSMTFSNVVAMLALFFALGGTVYAASGKIDGSQIKPKSLPANRLQAQSVTASQIKNGAIGAAQIKANAVGSKQVLSGAITGPKIKAGSITGTQVKSGSLTATQINQTTLTGVSAANIHTVQYVTVAVALANEAPAGTGGTAACPTGMKVIGGGATTSNPTYAFINESAPSADRNGWFATGYSGIAGVNMTITAICTPVAAPIG
ncbi:MAG TPA: hypothetical protein VH299_07005 [Solirubrobacterales bacterium]|jgi:hypothetical protein|nr:hypothetical protein [Solirubrobacterales bacterium]